MDLSLLDDFLNYLKTEKGFSKHTIGAYRRDILLFIAFLEKEGIDSFSLVAMATFFSFIAKLKEKNYAVNTIARTLMGLKTFFRFLHREKIVAEDVAKTLEAPKLRQGLPTILSEEEVEILLAAPDKNTFVGARDRAILELLYASGLRVSELCSLDIYDVDDTFVRVKGKGNKERLVPLGKSALAAIDSFLLHFRSHYESDREKALFVTIKGKRIHRVEIWKQLKAYAKKMGIAKEISPHSLRHTFATHLLDHGAPIRVIQEMLGHSSINSTNRYCQVGQSQLAAAFQRFHPRWN